MGLIGPDRGPGVAAGRSWRRQALLPVLPVEVLRSRGKRAVIPADRAARLTAVKAGRQAGYLTAERYSGVGA